MSLRALVVSSFLIAAVLLPTPHAVAYANLCKLESRPWIFGYIHHCKDVGCSLITPGPYDCKIDKIPPSFFFCECHYHPKKLGIVGFELFNFQLANGNPGGPPFAQGNGHSISPLASIDFDLEYFDPLTPGTQVVTATDFSFNVEIGEEDPDNPGFQFVTVESLTAQISNFASVGYGGAATGPNVLGLSDMDGAGRDANSLPYNWGRVNPATGEFSALLLVWWTDDQHPASAPWEVEIEVSGIVDALNHTATIDVFSIDGYLPCDEVECENE